jgi:hypothetical protein
MFFHVSDADYLHLYGLIVPILQKLEKSGQSSRSVQNLKLECLRRDQLLIANKVHIPWPIPSAEVFRVADEARERKEKANEKGRNGGLELHRASPRDSISNFSGATHSRKGSWTSATFYSADGAVPSLSNTEAGASRNHSGCASPKYFQGPNIKTASRTPVPRAPSQNGVPLMVIPRGPDSSTKTSSRTSPASASTNGIAKSASFMLATYSRAPQ